MCVRHYANVLNEVHTIHIQTGVLVFSYKPTLHLRVFEQVSVES
jgi:hypothetical protein